jgi:creatinine amidohydrolase/Fe(II)-dependent formamide hydrolase-like protein
MALRQLRGIAGEPRLSSAELGKRIFEMKVDYG